MKYLQSALTAICIIFACAVFVVLMMGLAVWDIFDELRKKYV